MHKRENENSEEGHHRLEVRKAKADLAEGTCRAICSGGLMIGSC